MEICLILPRRSLWPPSKIGVKAKFSCFQSVSGRLGRVGSAGQTKLTPRPVFWLSVNHRNITNVYSLYKLSFKNREDRGG